jgi:hypothetical protein
MRRYRGRDSWSEHGLASGERIEGQGGGSGEEVIDNAYAIADSNHGYRMIGVGALVAKELLEPFRFSRYETGELHPTSHSPFPWS